MKTKTKLFAFAIKVVKWLGLVLKQDQPIIPVTELIEFCERLHRIMQTRGMAFCIKYVKATRGNLYNYLSGNPIRDPISKCNKADGLPLILGSLSRFVRNDEYRVIAIIITVLSATRALKFKSDPDLSTITQPVKGDVPDMTKYMRDFWKEIGYRQCHEVPRKFLKANLKTFRLSKGPNGHALRTALADVKVIPQSLIRSFKHLSPRVGHAVEVLKLYQRYFIPFFSKVLWPFETKNSFRRISAFPDKEGKMRVVGVLDYYSQICLKPLHTYLSRVLSKIPQDCTLDQSKFKSGLLQKAEIYHSVDLSAATDRFPILLIKQLLKHQLPAEYVDAWADIMVGYPFDYAGNKLIYSAGNPMGAYSSFNSFALTHHYIIYYICRELGKSWKKLPYALLGDDIVIGDDSVGEMYKKVIRDLHMDYSPAKTHKSKDFYEFAKRLFYKGHEITPFPISALKECGKSYGLLTLLLLDSESKGYTFDSISSSVCKYFGVVKSLPSRVTKPFKEKSWLFESVLRVVRGVLPAAEFLAEYCRKKDYPFQSDEEECNYIFSLIISGIFRDSADKLLDPDDGLKIPLKSRVSTIILSWKKFLREHPDQLTDGEIRSMDLDLDKTPIYQAALAVIELYESLDRKFHDSSQYLGHWKYCMKQITVPTSEKSLLDNSKMRTLRTVNQFVAELERYMEEYSVPW